MRVLENKTAAELLEFIGKSPSCYHAVENIRRILLAEGYRELREWEPWQLREGGRYFTARNDSSLIAFRVPARDFSGFQMAAAHSDAPTFKLKENPELPDAHYLRLNTEPYGGMSTFGRLTMGEPTGVSLRMTLQLAVPPRISGP